MKEFFNDTLSFGFRYPEYENRNQAFYNHLGYYTYYIEHSQKQRHLQESLDVLNYTVNLNFFTI